jgi:hypothetical protein
MLGKVLPIADLYLKDKFPEPSIPVAPSRPGNSGATTANYNNKLTDFEGTYRSEELTTEYMILIKSGKLVMSHQRLSDIELLATGEDKFSGKNTFGFGMTFLRKGAEVIGFEISNFGAKNVRFEKVK